MRRRKRRKTRGEEKEEEEGKEEEEALWSRRSRARGLRHPSAAQGAAEAKEEEEDYTQSSRLSIPTRLRAPGVQG